MSDGDAQLTVAPALAESDAAFTKAQAALSRIREQASNSPRRVLAETPNLNSIVLWVQVGQTSILLGADLEETSDPQIGWTAILDSEMRPKGQAGAFKVPHHGSATGHHERVWAEMLADDCVALISPFVHGSRVLPTPADRARIHAKTEHAYLTAPPQVPRRVQYDAAVEKLMRRALRERHRVAGPAGHIRARYSDVNRPNLPWTVELFSGALKVAA